MRSPASFPALLVAICLVAGCQAPSAPPQLEPLPAPQRALDRALLHLRDVEAAERPYVDNGFIYYTRTDDMGRRVYCRRGVAPGAPEQVLLAGHEVADRTVSSIGAFDVSPDQRWLAFSTRMAGDRYTLRVKDLRSGDISTAIEGTDFAVAWAPTSDVLYYAALDENDRPKRVFAVEPGKLSRPSINARPARLVHEERDPSREVLVAPVDREAALFVRRPMGGMLAGSRSVLGYRLGGARELEGLPTPVASTPTDPSLGGSGLTTPPPANPAVR